MGHPVQFVKYAFELCIRYGSYLAYNYDQGHTDELGCRNPDGTNCDVYTDEITTLNIVMALFSGVSLEHFMSD